MRLWDLTTGATTRRFLGHTKDVLSVAFSVDNRQIVSGSRDRTIKLWNTIGECKYTIGEPDGHSEWVSCVRFSPAPANPIIVSAGWDKLVKVPFFFRFCFFRFCFFRNEVFLFLSQSLSVFLSFFLLLLPLLLLSSPPPPSRPPVAFNSPISFPYLKNQKPPSHFPGLEPHQLQAPLQPRRAHGLRRRRHRLPRRLALRLGREGRRRAPVGPGRGQAPLLPRRGRRHLGADLLAQPLLALRGHRLVRQDLGPGEQVDCRRAAPRLPSDVEEGRAALVHVAGVVGRRRDAVHGVHRRRDPRLGRQPRDLDVKSRERE